MPVQLPLQQIQLLLSFVVSATLPFASIVDALASRHSARAMGGLDKMTTVPRPMEAPEEMSRYYAFDALRFIFAAQILDSHKERMQLFSPTYFMLGHAAELLLKSYSFAFGTRKERFSGSQHDLCRLLDHAKTLGFSPSKNIEETIAWLGANHKSHAYRYADKPMVSSPLAKDVIAALAQMADEILPVSDKKLVELLQISQKAPLEP